MMKVRLQAGEVGDAAAEQEQAAEGERVGGDHHRWSASLMPRPALADGSARLTIEASRTAMSEAMPMTNSARQRIGSSGMPAAPSGRPRGARRSPRTRGAGGGHGRPRRSRGPGLPQVRSAGAGDNRQSTTRYSGPDPIPSVPGPVTDVDLPDVPARWLRAGFCPARGRSLPGVVEADDLGTYVVEVRGAGRAQGARGRGRGRDRGAARALVPELESWSSRRLAGQRAEPDEEVQDLLRPATAPTSAWTSRPGLLASSAPDGIGTRPRRPDPVARRLRRTSTARGATPTASWHGDPGSSTTAPPLTSHHDWSSLPRGRPRRTLSGPTTCCPASGPLRAVHDFACAPWSRTRWPRPPACPTNGLLGEPGLRPGRRGRRTPRFLARLEGARGLARPGGGGPCRRTMRRAVLRVVPRVERGEQVNVGSPFTAGRWTTSARRITDDLRARRDRPDLRRRRRAPALAAVADPGRPRSTPGAQRATHRRPVPVVGRPAQHRGADLGRAHHHRRPLR